MKPVRSLLVLALAVSTAGLALAGAKKQSAVSVRFYPEAGAEGGNFSNKVQIIPSGRSTYMGEIPLISEREIKAYYPFEARDGSRGVYFRLDDHGTNLLAQHTMSRRGSYIFAFFNGRHVVDLAVDKPVTDGIAVIPSGLTEHDISLLAITYPLIGQEQVKPSKKTSAPEVKKAPSPVPAKAEVPRPAPAMLRKPDGTAAPAPMVPGRAEPEIPAPVNPIGQ